MSRSTDDVLLDLARLVMDFSTRAADALGQISVVQLRALTVLSALGTATLGELAQGVGVTASTTSRLVDRLVAGGWADRQVSAESRRQLALRLTPAGEQTLAEYDRLRLTSLRDCLDRLPRERRDDVVSALAEFAAAGRPQPAEGRTGSEASGPDEQPGARPDEGGDPACWLQRVCPACGRLAEEDPPTTCAACGEPLPAG